MILTQPCDTLPGIGPKFAQKLAQCGIKTVQDLIWHLPYRYQDRTRVTPIQDLRVNDWCVVVGRICKTELKYGKRRMLYCYVEDKTGVLRLRFFHFNKAQHMALQIGATLCAFGEVREFSNQIEIIHPEYQILAHEAIYQVEEHLTPIYPSTQGLSQTRLRQLAKTALTLAHDTLQTCEWMSDEQLDQHGFMPLVRAMHELHHPAPDVSLQAFETGTHPGLQRVVFDELLAHQLSLRFARQHMRQLTAPPLPPATAITQHLLAALPFALTNAQQRVAHEIALDLSQTKPMLRLVQGDVGAGKTMIAILAALQAVDAGYQVAVMAPTDILSEQHAQTFTKWFTPLNITVQRLSGKIKAKERRETLHALRTKSCHIVIGTHALFQNEVEFAALGLVIIDEQHRFGVEQRLRLGQKNQQQQAHQLLMTATPIPRTLAMTQFAHLDMSILDELPPGRTPIITAIINQAKREHIIERLAHAIADGRQVYWVCTLIEESEKLQCMAATATAETLQAQLPHVRIGLIHGRMANDAKDSIMTAFKKGELDLLVATTVIEVGVDVPNASLMIIENAERLGLAQLHQLRGRVGRGTTQSHCLLLYQAPLSPQSQERLRVMRETCDGFIIAEKDLALRGSGEFLGKRQTGYRQFKLTNLTRDQKLLNYVKPMAQWLMQNKPQLAHAITKRWLGEFEIYLQG